MQCPKQKEQMDQQWSTKHYTEICNMEIVLDTKNIRKRHIPPIKQMWEKTSRTSWRTSQYVVGIFYQQISLPRYNLNIESGVKIQFDYSKYFTELIK